MIEIKDFKINGARGFELKIEELKISSGQFIQVFGNNNSGKSLLLQTLSGYHHDFSGKFIYNGIESKPKLLNTILLRYEPAFLKGESVEKNLRIPFSTFTARKRKIINDLLDKSALKDCMKDKISTLSRSQQKSLELIRAVVQLPHYLLIDDYDTFFDNTSLNQLSSVFEFAASAGTTIIITSLKQISSVLISYKLTNGELVRL